MKSSNPILREEVIQNGYSVNEHPMTVSGTMNKLLVLCAVMLISAAAVYYQFSLGRYDFVRSVMPAGCIIGLIVAIVLAFNQKLSPYLTPVYAFAQGAAISGISCFFEAAYPGIVIQAVSITMLTVLSMALLFKSGLIRATERFKSIIFTATAAIAGFYLISLVLMFFHVNIPYFTSTSPVAFVINVAIAVIAALNLIIDFDFIEKGSQNMMPAVYEWYGAFGLLVTVLWLYIEILRLLARARKR